MKFSLIYGITAGDWVKLLKQTHPTVNLRFLIRANLITVFSLLNSCYRRREEKTFNSQIKATRIENPPTFIIGHWRNGATHLQRLLAQDTQWAFPNVYQTLNPHSFLTSERRMARLLSYWVPRTRLEDNMPINLHVPSEDEIALSLLTLRSPYLAWVFPQRQTFYEPFLSLHTISATDREHWRAAYIWYLKKLTLRYQKPLMLKSPPNTSRIRFLLQLFPEARFIHIHRHPYAVYQSMWHLMTTWLRKYAILQASNSRNLEDEIIRRYQEMYQIFFFWR